MGGCLSKKAAFLYFKKEYLFAWKCAILEVTDLIKLHGFA